VHKGALYNQESFQTRVVLPFFTHFFLPCK